MTSLDQAFIKIYGQQGCEVDGRRPMPLSAALAAADQGAAECAPPADVPPRAATRAAVLDALARNTVAAQPGTRPRAVVRSAADQRSSSGPPIPAPHFVRRNPRPSAPRLDELLTDRPVEKPVEEPVEPAAEPRPAAACGPGAWVGSAAPLEPVGWVEHSTPSQAGIQTLETAEQSPAEPAGWVEQSEPYADLLSLPESEPPAAEPEDCQPPCAPSPEDSADESAEADAFRPALQVDRLLWPKVCQRLWTTAVAETDGLSAGLARLGDAHHRVIGFTACRRGAGATTLLLCAAERLAREGRRVIMVDADWDEADLGARVGLLPDCGWEDVLGGRMPVEEAVIRSLEDHVDLLPLMAQTEPPAAARIAASLRELAAQCDLVLVNAGPLDPDAPGPIAPHLDAVVMVCDLRAGEHARLDQACRYLEDQGVAEVAIVENFAH